MHREIPDQYKDIVLREAFLNGLKGSYQNALVQMKIFTLAYAYKEAQALEYAYSTKREGNRMASVTEYSTKQEQLTLKVISVLINFLTPTGWMKMLISVYFYRFSENT